MNKLREVLAKNLSRIRMAGGYTQESLAEATKLSQRMIQKIEHQLSWPSPETVEKLATVLKVDPCDFYAGNSKEKSSVRDAIVRFATLEDSQMHSALDYIQSVILADESPDQYEQKILSELDAHPALTKTRKPK